MEAAQVPCDGVVDSHVHVVGPLNRFPQASERHYLAAEASVDALRRAALPSVSRFVVVQPSFYGADNEVTLQAVAELGENGRAVVVVDPHTVTPVQLEALHARGARGIRINLNSTLKGDRREIPEQLALHSPIALAMGWHIEVVLPFDTLVAAAGQLAAQPVPMVIDHFGLPIGRVPDSDGGRTVLDLAGQPNIWIKLSAPYRVGADPLATTSPADWLHAYLERAPERCLWGSDWPYTPTKADQVSRDAIAPYRPISYRSLLDNFCNAVPREALLRVTTTNPETLYGFRRA